MTGSWDSSEMLGGASHSRNHMEPLEFSHIGNISMYHFSLMPVQAFELVLRLKEE